MLKSRGILAILALGLFLSVFTGGSSFAADVKATASFGTVDVEKAFDNYDKKKQLDQELMNYADQLKQKLDLRKTNKLLKPEEFNQLAELKVKPNPTDDEKKKIEDFLALSKQREQELQALQQKQDTTDVEKARLKELTDQSANTDAALKEELGKSQNDLAGKQIDLSRQVMQEVEAAIAEVAKAKGLTIVFNKSASEPGLIAYSSLDITDEVLKKLNKK